MIVTLCGVPFTIIGEIHRAGQPSVKVDLFYREGGSKSPCKWGSGSGIYIHTDCVQAAGCMDLNVDNLNCDFMTISSHKIHGPKGVGALYIRDPSKITPIVGGSHQEFGMRCGTENVPGIIGFA